VLAGDPPLAAAQPGFGAPAFKLVEDLLHRAS
jgi:hypothetical protein